MGNYTRHITDIYDHRALICNTVTTLVPGNIWSEYGNFNHRHIELVVRRISRDMARCLKREGGDR